MTLFDKIIDRSIPAFILKEDENFIAFLDIFPLQKGHSLVVPKIAIDKFFELPNDYLSKILLFAKPIAAAIQKAFPCNRVNIATVGFEVPHAHLHLLPSNSLNDMLFTQPKLSLSPAEFLAIQEKIMACLPDFE